MSRYLLTMLLGLLLVGCASLSWQKPGVRIANIQPTSDSTLFEQAFDITLRVSNPNHYELKAQGLQFNIKLDGEAFARGQSKQALNIAASSDSMVTVRVYTSLAGWLQQLGKRLSGADALNYQIDGTLNQVNSLGDLPFNSEGKWQLPR